MEILVAKIESRGKAFVRSADYRFLDEATIS
jgi:hypothetical protein